MVELRHLRYFIAVAEELNFSRAAQRMHMAQPPLSAAIRQLERDLGVDLFVRTTREVKLTDAGDAFLAGARRTLAEAERAAEDAKRAAAGELGQLRIAYSWSTRFATLPALGRAFRATHPDVELMAQEMWNARMPPAFANGGIDVALSLCPEIAAELQLAPIRKERLVALLPEAHPLAREETIPLSALADDEFIVFPREIAPRLHDAFMSIYRRAGFEPRVRNESFHTGWDLGVLADIPAVATAPETVAGGLPDGIVAVAVSEPTDALETCVVWRADDSSPIVAAFVDVAQDTLTRSV
jgi:LysR family transcriptional regulator, benzoate and cis,cis-muconate-responsive activator of ben and cat genes